MTQEQQADEMKGGCLYAIVAAIVIVAIVVTVIGITVYVSI
jgi:hypothetical protein